MPERNVVQVSVVYDKIRKRSVKYIPVKYETILDTGLIFSPIDFGQYLKGNVHRVMNSQYNTIKEINKVFEFTPFRSFPENYLEDTREIKEKRFVSTARKIEMLNWIGDRVISGLMLQKELVDMYGVQKGEVIEVTYTEFKNSKGDKRSLYPEVTRNGLLPEDFPANQDYKYSTKSPFISVEIGGNFFPPLISEINTAFDRGLFRSCYILIRVLLENLLIDLLRAHLGVNKSEREKYFHNNRFRSLSELSKTLQADRPSYLIYSSGLKEMNDDIIKYFAEKGNFSAHSIAVNFKRDDLINMKGDLNFTISVLAEAVKNASLNKSNKESKNPNYTNLS